MKLTGECTFAIRRVHTEFESDECVVIGIIHSFAMIKSNPNHNGTLTATKQSIQGRMMKKGRQGSALMTIIKFLIVFTFATVVSMPFLVSFLSSFHETSTLEHYLVTSKVSHSPFVNHATKTTADNNMPLWFHDSLQDPPSNAPYTILHTVTTRFMVGQAPNTTGGLTKRNHKQLEIQTARYKLFETFCWPSMQKQTSMNFYWIVLVDPGLDPSIIEGMRQLLNQTHFPAQNAFLVLTNNTQWASDGVGVENSTSYGVGLQPVAQEFRDGKLQVVTGQTDYLLQALDMMDGSESNSNLRSSNSTKQQKPLLVIETLLDADDGLNNGAVEWIQTKAIARTQEHWKQLQLHQTAIPSLNTTWWFLCGTDHIEWHNRRIFQLTEEQYAAKGIGSGLAGLRQSPLFCTSAGFTRIGLTAPNHNNYSHMVFPKDGYSNHALTFYFPECNNASTPLHGNYSACWHREFPNQAYIVKSRTITSDSMDHLNVGKMKDYRDISWLNASDYPLIVNDTERMWNLLKEEFSIDRHKAWETSKYIFEHRQSILKQNRDSRCSPGFPCWKTAKKNLLKMERYWSKQRIAAREKAKEAAAANQTNATTAELDNKNEIAENKKKFMQRIEKIHAKKFVNPSSLHDDDDSAIPKNKTLILAAMEPMSVNQTNTTVNTTETHVLKGHNQKSIHDVIEDAKRRKEEHNQKSIHDVIEDAKSRKEESNA